MVKHLDLFKNILLIISLSYNVYCTRAGHLQRLDLEEQVADLKKEVAALTEQVRLLSESNLHNLKESEVPEGVISWLSKYYDPTPFDLLILIGGTCLFIVLFYQVTGAGRFDFLLNRMHEPGYAYWNGNKLTLIEKRADFLKVVFSYVPENKHFKHVKYTDTQAATNFIAELFVKEKLEQVVKEIKENYTDFEVDHIKPGTLNWVFPKKLPKGLIPGVNSLLEYFGFI